MKAYKILTTAMAAAVLSGASAMAQFNYQNGDLLAAFGNGGTTDVVVDLGPISNFQVFNGPAFAVNLSSVLTSTFGSVNSGIYWAVFGVNDTTQPSSNGSVVQGGPYTVWGTLARPDPAIQNDAPNVSGNANSQHLAVNQIGTITGLTTPSAGGPGQIIDYSAGIEQVATSLGGYSSLMNPDGNLGGTWGYNMLNNGPGTSDLFQSDPGNPFAASQNYLGQFSLDSSGVLSFQPVPEPSSLAMVGAGFLMLAALRRRK